MSSPLGIFIKRDDTQDPNRPANVGGSQDVADVRARMVKVFNSAVHAKYIHNRDKTVVVVVRHMPILEDPFDRGDYPLTAAGARVYWRDVALPFINRFQDKTRYIYNLPPNEPGVGDGELAALTEWWVTLCGLAAEAGVMICVGNWSSEVRLWDKAAKVLDMVRACIAGGHWWDQHGYAPDLLDPTYEEYLYPWRKFRISLSALGINTAKLKILAGEWGEDQNLFLNINQPGYRNHMSNETYTDQLMKAAVGLIQDGVVAFVFWFTHASDDQFMQYNINIGNPSVWDLIVPWIVAQAGIVEVPPVEPPPTIPQPGRYTVSNLKGLNIRLQPTLAGAVIGAYNDLAPVDIENFVSGASVYGNTWWGKVDGQSHYVSAYYLKKG